MSRRQHHTVTQILGPKLAFRKDGFKLKHFTRRFFKLYIFKATGKELVAEGEPDRKAISDKRLIELVAYSLNLSPDALMPSTHAYATFENPMMMVLLIEYEAMGSRLEDISLATVMNYVYFVWAKEDPTKVTCVLSKESVELPWDEETMKENEWELKDPGSLNDCRIVCTALGRVQHIRPLFKDSLSLAALPDENRTFEHPEAVDKLEKEVAALGVQADTSSPASKGGASPTNPAASSENGSLPGSGEALPAADSEDVIAAGEAPPVAMLPS